MNDLVLRVQDLRLKYKYNPVPVLDQISFELSKSDCLLISGDIGSGKSTLIRAIARQFPVGSLDEVSGDISLDANPVVVYQRPSSQILTFRVDEEIASSLSFNKMPRKERIQVITEFMIEHNIDILSSRDPRNLSAGEQQIVVLLATLIKESNVVLLDEPVSLLDKENQSKFLDFIKFLRKKGITLIIVDHNPLIYANICNKILILEAGKCDYFGDYEVGIKDKYANFVVDELSFTQIIDHTWTINAVLGYTTPIQHISQSLPRYGLIMVTGVNGSGKSLLLRSIAGFIKPISGSLEMPKNFIYLAQDTFSFFWRKSIAEEWSFKESLPKWLIPKENFSPFLLSEGERKKLALEICIASHRPLLLDEPSQGLDLASINWLCMILSGISKTQLVIIATNDELLINQLNKITSINILLDKEKEITDLGD